MKRKDEERMRLRTSPTHELLAETFKGLSITLLGEIVSKLILCVNTKNLEKLLGAFDHPPEPMPLDQKVTGVIGKMLLSH